jgi:hypothetical protein
LTGLFEMTPQVACAICRCHPLLLIFE